jgi:hypothetical protein
MTLGEAELIFESWHEAPPTHHLMHVLAQLWGWKLPVRKRTSTADMQEVLAIPGMMQKPVGEGLPMVVLDFETLKAQFRTGTGMRRNRAGS